MSSRPDELTSEMPAELRGWNWGAFLLNWIWGLGNRTPIALLTLIPLVGIVMMFVLGAKGNRWAWENERWKSIAHFRRTQRHWAIAGVIVWVVFTALFVGGAWGMHALMTKNGAYVKTMEVLRADLSVEEIYGRPVQDGWFPTGSVSVENSRGEANLEISISGPKASGTAYSEATREAGIWRLTYLATRVDGGQDVVVIIPRE